MNRFIILLFVLIYTGCKAQEQAIRTYPPVELSRTEVRLLPSEIVGITYKLYISLPYDFDSTKAYPIIFLLDPEYSFAIAKNITDHLSERNNLEDVLLVGIGYEVDNYRLNRTRDYTPSFTLEGGYGEALQRHSGGAPLFLDFIEKELFSFIEKQYCKAKNKTLTGHSFGGLFTTWTLINRPHLFDRYIAVSPSLWYDNKKIFKQLDKMEKGSMKEKIFFTVGSLEINSNINMVQDLQNFTEQLQIKKISGMDFMATYLENETHNTVFPRAFSDGLRYVFGLR